jgi:serine/threonine protein kinase
VLVTPKFIKRYLSGERFILYYTEIKKRRILGFTLFLLEEFMADDLLDDRYQKIRDLEPGGFGRTWEAVDIKKFDHKCVVKKLEPKGDLDSKTMEKLKERFKREAKTLDKLGIHDQIPELYAHIVINNQFYIVQEFIEGKTLGQLIQKTGRFFSEEEAIKFLENILPVLNFVHSHGAMHLDISPKNIMLREKDGKPVLIDFGAVKEALTASFDINGNPSTLIIYTEEYAALEQKDGKPCKASDVYALGLTTIFLLTGKTKSQINDSFIRTLEWQKYVPQVSSAFAEVLNKSIQEYPDGRYSDANEMHKALQSLRTVNINREDRGELKVPRKNWFKQLLLVSGIVLTLVIVSFLGFTAWQKFLGDKKSESGEIVKNPGNEPIPTHLSSTPFFRHGFLRMNWTF